jgi:hypothetical protein
VDGLKPARPKSNQKFSTFEFPCPLYVGRLLNRAFSPTPHDLARHYAVAIYESRTLSPRLCTHQDLYVVLP